MTRDQLPAGLSSSEAPATVPVAATSAEHTAAEIFGNEGIMNTRNESESERKKKEKKDMKKEKKDMAKINGAACCLLGEKLSERRCLLRRSKLSSFTVTAVGAGEKMSESVSKKSVGEFSHGRKGP